MWPYDTRRETRPYLLNLIRQLLVRTLLLIAVCLMVVKVSPRIQEIPHEKLLCEYRRPRRPSAFPVWAMIFLIVIEPLVIFWMLSRDFRDAVEIILTWSLAITITITITEILKNAVGRPRPDFYYRCFPDGSIPSNIQRCTGEPKEIMEGRKSFPSGHTSLSFASLGILSLFLYRRCIVLYDGQNRASQLLCYSMPLMVASTIGISRCLDNHHHWEDVLAGAIIGFATACFCYRSDLDTSCSSTSDTQIFT